jgi:hypothetical protein
VMSLVDRDVFDANFLVGLRWKHMRQGSRDGNVEDEANVAELLLLCKIRLSRNTPQTERYYRQIALPPSHISLCWNDSTFHSPNGGAARVHTGAVTAATPRLCRSPDAPPDRLSNGWTIPDLHFCAMPRCLPISPPRHGARLPRRRSPASRPAATGSPGCAAGPPPRPGASASRQ